MGGPLLETKLRLPRRRRNEVPRPRLIEQLNRGLESPLTLVSAPAGFGKTTVLGEWLSNSSREPVRAAWLSLDQGDNDPTLFWSYVIAALRTVADAVGSTALSLLESPQPSTEAVIAALINDLDALGEDLVLVLDDYHVVDERRVRDEVGFFLDHLPHNVHVVIASRADPTLPLARLRARGDLVEVRAADLRFTTAESKAYLTQKMGLGLTDQDVTALDGRTEGWIAALQLTALSMQGRDDAAQFIAGFAGDDRYIVDYLAEEVLQRQPDEVRRFLLQTSILDRLSAPLCDAVTTQSDSRGMLLALEQGNLFLTPLDDRREWYRYHQLFAGVLRTHLLDEQPGLVCDLHSRASAWYAGNREPSEAIRHAVSAGDLGRAADLAELAVPELRRDRREAEIRGWLRLLPADLVATRPVLNLGFVGALMSVGEFDEVEDRLDDVERLLSAGTADFVVVDDDQFRQLPGMLEMNRAAVELARGDLASTTAHARAAIGLAAEDDHMCRAGSSALLGLASWSAGELDAAYSAYAEGMAGLERAGFASDVVGGAVTLADIRIDQGRLGDALRIYERALDRAHGEGRALRGIVDVYVGLSEIHCERGDLDAARELLGQVTSLGEHLGLPKSPFRSRRVQAGIRWPRAGRTTRSGCSTRPSASTRRTSPRTCVRSRPSGPG